MSSKIMVTEKVEDFERALLTDEVGAVMHKGYVCSCSIGNEWKKRILDAIEASSAKIIGCCTCEDEASYIEQCGKVYIHPFEEDEREATYANFVLAAIETKRSEKRHKIIGSITGGESVRPDFLEQESFVSELTSAVDNGRILVVENLSFYSQFGRDWGKQAVHFSHKDANGVVYCDADGNVIGQLSLQVSFPFTGTLTNSLRESLKEYDIHILDLGLFNPSIKIRVHGIRKRTGNQGRSWYAYRQHEEGQIRYSIHGDMEATEAFGQQIKQALAEYDKIEEDLLAQLN